MREQRGCEMSKIKVSSVTPHRDAECQSVTQSVRVRRMWFECSMPGAWRPSERKRLGTDENLYDLLGADLFRLIRGSISLELNPPSTIQYKCCI